MGQFPFHPGALLPYSAGTMDRSQSQQLFHPTGGYKLAQDSITGQFFFIPGSVAVIAFAYFGKCLSCSVVGHRSRLV